MTTTRTLTPHQLAQLPETMSACARDWAATSPSSFLPKPLQLCNALLRLVGPGALQVPRDELAKALGWPSETVRYALLYLSEKGLVQRKRTRKGLLSFELREVAAGRGAELARSGATALLVEHLAGLLTTDHYLPVNLNEVAKKAGVSYALLTKVLRELERQGLVSSRRSIYRALRASPKLQEMSCGAQTNRVQ